MHKSKLSTFVIDCQDGDIDEATRFWSREKVALSPRTGTEHSPDQEAPKHMDLWRQHRKTRTWDRSIFGVCR